MMRETNWKEVTEQGGRFRIRAQYGIDYGFADQHHQPPYFAMTASVERRAGTRWLEDGGGAMHQEIARHFPELAGFVKWHLVSPEGPMHYIANAKYWWEKVLGVSKYKSVAGEPDALEAFKNVTILGALTGDAMPDPRMPWSDVAAWLHARLPDLLANFKADMKSLEVWDKGGQ